MKINEILCKIALSPSKLPGLKYSLNPYKGCEHNCAYCYVPNILRIPRGEWGTFVSVKKNIPSVLSKEIKKKKIGTVGLSTVTDPYQPVEKKFQLTRHCLEQLLIHDFPVCIQTKSSLVTRDIDIVSKFSNVELMLSIATIKDEERKKLEPFSSSIEDRLKTLKQFSEMDIKTSIFFGPIYPTIKKNDIPTIVDSFIQFGAKEIMVDKLNLKPGINDNIIKVFPPYKNIIECVDNYQELLDELKRVCKEKNVKVINAF